MTVKQIVSTHLQTVTPDSDVFLLFISSWSPNRSWHDEKTHFERCSSLFYLFGASHDTPRGTVGHLGHTGVGKTAIRWKLGRSRKRTSGGWDGFSCWNTAAFLTWDWIGKEEAEHEKTYIYIYTLYYNIKFILYYVMLSYVILYYV